MQGREGIADRGEDIGQEVREKPAVELRGKRVLVIGLARTGLATAQFCADRGARVTVIERQPENGAGATHSIAEKASMLRTVGVSVHCGGDFPALYSEAELIIPSPGVPANLAGVAQARKKGITVWSEIELAWRFLRGRLIAITGSNGKTTTTSLLAHILREAGLPTLVGGNIGTPLISVVDQSTEKTVTVAEVSTFQLELTEEFRPDVAVLLNITPDHLDRHGSFDEYARLKRRIFANQGASEEAVLNADDPETIRIVPAGPRESRFSRLRPVSRGAFVRNGQIVLRDDNWESAITAVADVPLLGVHNLENILAASFAAHLAGAKPEQISAAIRSFRAVEHRLEFVAEIEGVRYYNDSKATNVDATVKALESFSRPVHLILGGRDKGGDFTKLKDALSRHARAALLIGEAATKIGEQLHAAVPIEFSGTLEAAIAAAAANAREGDVVLLSPGCASFDQFENYEHRGQVFKQLVAELNKNEAAAAAGRRG